LYFQAQLFGAAAAFTLFERGRGRDASLRERATAHVRTCQRLRPGYLLDPRVFSPRFIAFYQSVR
jgi:hypothetical protein